MRGSRSVTAALVLGVLLGAAVTHVYYRHVVKAESEKWKSAVQVRGDKWLLGDLTSSVIEKVTTLTGLRRGSTGYVIESKEQALSEAIAELFSSYPGQALTNELSLKALSMAARYRTEHPFDTGDLAVDKTVKEVLAAVERKMVHPSGGVPER